MKDQLIRDIEIKLTLQGYSRDEVEKITNCVIAALGDYEVTKAVTDLAVRYEDTNAEIIKRYVVGMHIGGKSKRTIALYMQTFNRLSESCRKPLTELTANDIRLFLGNLKMAGRKNSYIKSQRAIISALCKWMVAEEMIEKDPCSKVNNIKVEQEIRLPFSPVEIDRLRSVACRHELRDRAIIETLLSSGVRCEELCNLNIDDLDLKSRTVHVRRGKGGKGRIVFISEVAADYIRRYLDTRTDDGPELFISQYKARPSTSAINKMLKKRAKMAGVEDVHPHRFRRTFATTMYKRGMDLEEIRRLMGHSNVQTTLRYIHSDDIQLKAAYDKYAA